MDFFSLENTRNIVDCNCGGESSTLCLVLNGRHFSVHVTRRGGVIVPCFIGRPFAPVPAPDVPAPAPDVLEVLPDVFDDEVGEVLMMDASGDDGDSEYEEDEDGRPILQIQHGARDLLSQEEEDDAMDDMPPLEDDPNLVRHVFDAAIDHNLVLRARAAAAADDDELSDSGGEPEPENDEEREYLAAAADFDAEDYEPSDDEDVSDELSDDESTGSESDEMILLDH